MALNWSLVLFFCLGILWTYSTVRTAYRLAIGQDDPDFIEIISSYGYQAENHTVLTEDGYLLTIFRIAHSENCTKEKIRTPVLLVNGLIATADSFLDAGVEAGLPFLISDACHDLWIGNARGTYYGRRHIALDPDNSKEFWDFSLDEIGLYDVPATIDYVLNTTGVKQLNYIGVSQGTGSFLVMCSERPDYTNKVRVLIGLAPASKHTNAKSPVFRLIATFFRDHQEFLEYIGMWETLWKGMVHALGTACQFKPELCEAVIFSLDAPHPGSYSRETLKKVLSHFPAGTSVKNMARYGQSVNSDKFTKFDYGPEKNKKLYGGEPPEFNLSAVTVPTVIIYGKNDGIVDYKDGVWLVSQLPNVQEVVVLEDPLWNHLDMVASKDIPHAMFPKIREYLELYSNDTSYSAYTNDVSNDTSYSAYTNDVSNDNSYSAYTNDVSNDTSYSAYTNDVSNDIS